MDVVGNYELVVDYRDLSDFKRNLDDGLPIDECIKSQCFICGVEPTWTKSVRMSSEPNESQKEFAEFILQSIRDYISRQKKLGLKHS